MLTFTELMFVPEAGVTTGTPTLKLKTALATWLYGPFTLGTNGTLKVKGFKNGFVTSQTASAVFNLTVSSPTIAPPGATSNNSVTVTLNSTPGARLFWTIDGTEPTTSSALYNGPFSLGTNGTLKVKGFRNGFVDSQTSSAVFNLAV